MNDRHLLADIFIAGNCALSALFVFAFQYALTELRDVSFGFGFVAVGFFLLELVLAFAFSLVNKAPSQVMAFFITVVGFAAIIYSVNELTKIC